MPDNHDIVRTFVALSSRSCRDHEPGDERGQGDGSPELETVGAERLRGGHARAPLLAQFASAVWAFVADSCRMDALLTGGCLCGGVRFELSEAPQFAGYCHCTRCQRRTGTASSAQARVNGRALRIVQGEELGRGWCHPEGGFEKCFCRECGAHLFSRDPDDDTRVNVRMSAFDGDPGVRPTVRVYAAYAAAWEPIPDDGLQRFEEQLPS